MRVQNLVLEIVIKAYYLFVFLSETLKMKIHFLLFSLLFTIITFSQNKALKITNSTLQKQIIIKEHKRIRLKTKNGERLSGRFAILDKNYILIKHRKVAIDEIIKLKRNPLLASIIISGFFYYNAATALTVGFLIYVITQNSAAILLSIPATTFIYGGIKPPNLLKGHKTKKDWKYEIITIPDS